MLCDLGSTRGLIALNPSRESCFGERERDRFLWFSLKTLETEGKQRKEKETEREIEKEKERERETGEGERDSGFPVPL